MRAGLLESCRNTMPEIEPKPVRLRDSAGKGAGFTREYGHEFGHVISLHFISGTRVQTLVC